MQPLSGFSSVFFPASWLKLENQFRKAFMQALPETVKVIK